MKIYYRDPPVVIIHGDSREIVPTLKPSLFWPGTGDKFDLLLTDPPFSERTHNGHNKSSFGNLGAGSDGSKRKSIPYDFVTNEQAEADAAMFANAVNGWCVWMTDHSLAPVVIKSWENEGRYVFAPLPFFWPGSTVRLSGDGPCSWTTWILVSRTSKQSRWGTLPGGYVAGPGWNESRHMGGKPLMLMTALVRDYSKCAQTILDPFAGACTTARAAKDLGRKCVCIEREERYCEIGAKRMQQEVMSFAPPVKLSEQPIELL